MNTIIPEQLVAFKYYVYSFYGKGGIYAKKDFATKTQIKSAIFDYYASTSEEGLVTWGEGDSIDRERVAEILMSTYNVNLY